MQLEDFFDFVADPVEAIRLRGTRVDLQDVVELHRLGVPPERIADRYVGVELLSVYGAVAYYLANREAVEAYLARREAVAHDNRERSRRQTPSPALERVRALKAGTAMPGVAVNAS
jgi:uncharacterized protein (DUF433 family)